jgi:hypothetical protein
VKTLKLFLAIFASNVFGTWTAPGKRDAERDRARASETNVYWDPEPPITYQMLSPRTDLRLKSDLNMYGQLFAKGRWSAPVLCR